jgi:hypothetical protein
MIPYAVFLSDDDGNSSVPLLDLRHSSFHVCTQRERGLQVDLGLCPFWCLRLKCVFRFNGFHYHYCLVR